MSVIDDVRLVVKEEPRHIVVWLALALLGWIVLLLAVTLAGLAVLGIYHIREALVG